MNPRRQQRPGDGRDGGEDSAGTEGGGGLHRARHVTHGAVETATSQVTAAPATS